MPVYNIKDKKILVLGGALSGLSAALKAYEAGAHVTVNDLKEITLPDNLKDKVNIVCGSHPQELLDSQDIIILSPGVPPLDVVKNAQKKGVEVIGEVEFTLRFTDAKIAAITGTNGKSTTVSLLGDILNCMAPNVFTGGNLGTPFSQTIGTDLAKADALVSLELSSFQLETITSLKADVVALLNLQEDHLDRYATFDEYVEAKLRIFKGLSDHGVAVVNADDDLVMKYARESGVKLTTFSVEGRPADFYRQGEKLVFGPYDFHLPVNIINLPGRHNQANVLAAVGCALHMGAKSSEIMKAVSEFRGLEHRMQFSGELSGVKFYNDSKATNIGSVAGSLGGFEGRYALILGGRHKGTPYTSLKDVLLPNCRLIVAIGESADLIENDLGACIPLKRSKTMAQAIKIAFEAVKSGENVILSPACSSYDMFKNYVERGNTFMDCVKDLINQNRIQ
ncbi:UDP-N-acetylmuramoyl-L-alanine--D-glutamate ligase [Myxococcota bacterium]|nr:UDP-N-acetylmuramoyl-L-alanine--D-glutamate ligase [Myxococcota bacterium]MBU1381823.1 UDP-N-acetylmuramoyl-L-alanine--D-glutamate ligase [Myxococcota bacterium]MBU1498600.1 UDP-N-acetylmuramoyl-L-alanine--D-glutamate ligase [Myxococcota bacterium]